MANQDEDRKKEEYRKEAIRRLSSFRVGNNGQTEEESKELKAMAANRRVNRRTAAAAGQGGGGGSAQFATGRSRDPLFYWKQNNLPYNYQEGNQLTKIRDYCQLLYSSHSLIGSCVDIYSKYPLLDMELKCHDDDISQFYTDLFFSEEGLNYESFFVDLGVSYWTLGEAFPLGSFNEKLGIWESDELIHPNHVEVTRSPFLKEPRFEMRLPDNIKHILDTREPAWEYARLLQDYPELARYMNSDERIPVSNVLMRQLKFKGDLFHDRGVPLLMRAMRPVMQEEMLNAAMDSIADRLYTPLIHAKIGASASDLGTTMPWIPTQDDLAEFNEQLDMALAGDFRVMATNFATQMDSLFGRENQPDFSPDFQRIQGRILQTFGLSETLLTGASGGQTYAADALNKQLVGQLLSNYQRLLASHFRQRALVVAEAQEHYDYEERNGKRYVKMEEVLEVDEETGEERIVEQPKLLVPDISFRSLDLSDENANRQFFEQLAGAGVPISIKTRMINIPFQLDDEIEQTKDEKVQLAVAEQETRKAQFKALRQAGLPIPDDLRQDFEPKAQQGQPQDAAEQTRTPLLGLDSTLDTANLAPTPGDLQNEPAPGTVAPGAPTQPVDPTAVMQEAVGANPAVPPESNEMREGMPRAASLWQSAENMRRVTADHWKPEEEKLSVEYTDKEGNLVQDEVDNDAPRGLFGAPKHVGMRRHAVNSQLAKKPMEKWGE